MKKICAVFFLYLDTISGISSAAVAPRFEQLNGRYQIYSRGLGDPTAPTKNDAKIAFVIQGPAALGMFNAMGPNAKDLCTEGTGTRVRVRDNQNVVCARSVTGEYSCRFGFNLKTGKSIGGSIC